MAQDKNGRGKKASPRLRKAAVTRRSQNLTLGSRSEAESRVSKLSLARQLSEAHEREAATAEILKLIASSPSDVGPIFEAIAERSNRLLGGLSTAVYQLDGNLLHLAAFTRRDEIADAALMKLFPRPISDMPWQERAAREARPVQVVNTDIEFAGNAALLDLALKRGFRSVLLVPLLRHSACIGIISVTRTEVGSFNDELIRLLRTFADQAVIGIENVRLFNETKEALQQQTATADVLKVISRSAFELEPVLKALVESAARLCEADKAFVYRRDADMFRLAATHGFPADYEDFMKRTPVQPGRGTLIGRTTLEAGVVHIPDCLSDAEYSWRESQERGGYRTMLGVPLLREGVPIGVLAMTRSVVKPFTEKQIALITTFADQAVIAIENVRLFDQVQQRTRDLSEALQQQTATSEVLRVISSSSGDIQPVFKVMLDNALKICGASYGNMMLWSGDGFEAAELHNSPPAFADLFKNGPLVPPPGTALGRVAATRKVVHVPDILAESGDVQQTPLRVVTVESMRARSLLAVPMLRESELIGVIVIYRQEVRPFSEKQIELVTNFADQAVIAIENARLLNELRMRTEELSQSLEDLRAAQDRLVQTEKLASLGQLTAGIAHEIKNPLNFVNNFSALSTELIEEMKDMLSDVSLDKNKREGLDEITQMLKSNLDKVVQHGKRADSIVKNMLLHSRQGSGEHRPIDINAIVDESLNLAYHGARAENTGFNITMHRSFDPAVGMADGYPQEITRALLNLISNGFYAATKRKEDADDGFEPTLTAATKNLGDKVEIRIRDNGTGIPTEVKEKIFNPFFTTKPAGEGTGLGLSMSHDIIVKQHGGTMDVDTVPGVFTEFKIVLPRAGVSLIKSGEHP
jgi:two-component system, NtrC family, sensor kinase